MRGSADARVGAARAEDHKPAGAIERGAGRREDRVAVLVVTFNSREHLSDLIGSLRAQSHRTWDLTVVDSNSSDRTREWLATHCPEARWIASSRNLGYRAGNRMAMEAASRDGRAPRYMLLVNDDVELHPFALERMVAAAEATPQVAIVAPAILVHAHAGRVNAAGSSLMPAGFYAARGKDEDYGGYRRPGEIAAASGCCFLYRMAAYRELGGFDMIFDSLPGDWHASAEDLDLSWRAWLRGKRVVYEPGAILWHKYRQRAMNPSRYASLVAGRLAFLALNFRGRELLCLLPLLLATEAALACHSALRGFRFVRAWLDGYIWLAGNRRRLAGIRRRRRVQAQITSSSLGWLMRASAPMAPSVRNNPVVRVALILWFALNWVSLAMPRMAGAGGAAARAALKRALDFSAAALMLLAFSPVLVGVGAAVALTMGRPVLFRQVRIGWREKPFTLYKFRTMHDGRDPTGVVLPDERRLTRLGRWLRSWSIDELPQLWNVLKGEMSFIGPRPLLPEYLPRYSVNQRRRHAVRPGLSGWAQVCGRNATTWERRLALDAEYAERRSIGLDLWIALLTVKKLILREGISQEGQATMEEFRGVESHG